MRDLLNGLLTGRIAALKRRFEIGFLRYSLARSIIWIVDRGFGKLRSNHILSD